MAAALQQRHHRIGGRHPGGECQGVMAALQRRQVALQSGASGVCGARVFVSLMFAKFLLHICRSLDRWGTTTAPVEGLSGSCPI